MLPDGSGAGRGGAGAEPAAATPGVPTFTSTELHKQLDAVLGKGASGTVYSLRDFPGLAVKEIQLDGLDQRSIDAARLELATLPALSHPGILRYHQVIENDSFIYIVMDRHDGTLECLLIEHKRKKTRVSSRLICSIARQVAAALAYLHGFCGTDVNGRPFRGLVHRDLKPANILVSEGGKHVAIADFGLCKDVTHSGKTFVGTMEYMAPETLLNSKTSTASDIWALGVIIYELAALKRPNFLEGKEPKDVFINGWRPDLSAIKDDFIKIVLEKIFVLDPEKRLTANELAELLQEPNVPTIELKAPTNVPDERCKSLEAALNGVNARLELLESSLRVKTDEIDSLRKKLEMKSDQIDALEGQCKEHLAMMKALENKIALLTASNPQSGILLLPRLMRAAHTNSTEAVRVLVESGDGICKRDEQGMTALMHAAQQGHVEPVRLLVKKEKGLQDRSGWTALMHAVHNNHPGVVEILAAYECGKRENSNRTALMIAAERGHAEIVAALAPHEKGLTDSSGRTALMLAASNAHTEAVRVLIEHEKGMKDKQGHNALYYALKSGHLKDVYFLIEADDPTDENGVTALMRAAARGDAKLVELLVPIQKGMKDRVGNTAFVHALKNKHEGIATVLRKHEAPSWTPLMCAAVTGDVETARRHLNEKNKKNSDGDTALMIAARAGHVNIVELLDPTDKDGVTALMRAAERGDAEVVRALIPLQKGKKATGGVTINGWKIYGGTALMIAAACGHTEAVRLLVEKEGGLQDDAGQTALMWAAQSGHTDCVKLLLDREGGMQTKDGWTALMCAAWSGHADCVKLLAEKEGGTQENDGETALMFAAENCHLECVKLLLEKEVCMQSNDGQTALMYAARKGKADCIRLLLDKEVGMQDADGQTALMWAAQDGHVECVKLLLEKEGRMQDGWGLTALMHAAERGHVDCMKLLLEREICMQDKDGWTALMKAAQNGHIDCMKLLLEREGGMQRVTVGQPS